MTIKVLYVPVGGAPEIRETDNGLRAMQNLVGGDIEVFPLDSLEPSPNLDAFAVLNEEGKFTPGIMPNRNVYHLGKVFDTFYGGFFICGTNEEGELVSITSKQEAYYSRMFKLHMPPNGIKSGGK